MIQLITGPMGAGKSELLINTNEYCKQNNKRVLTFKPESDTRTKNSIKSRNGKEIFAIEVKSFYSIIDIILNTKKPNVIIIDEVQFLKQTGFKDLFNLCNKHDIDLILGGIDLTSELTPFKTIKEISPYCTEILKLSTKCHYCGGKANYTKCTISKTQEVLVGNDIYVATCYKCHQNNTEVIKC